MRARERERELRRAKGVNSQFRGEGHGIWEETV